MALTTIGDQLTPGDPTEITLAAETGLPSSLKTLVLIGAMGPTGGPSGGGTASGTATPYTAVRLSNVARRTAAIAELTTKFGVDSQMYKMGLAAIVANEQGAVFPPITCIPLPQGATSFGTTDQALTTLDKIPGDVVASPFDGTSATLRTKLLTQAAVMSGAARVANGQYGTVACFANFSVTDPSLLPKPDTQYFSGAWLRDTGTNPYSVAELSAAYAALLASNPIPFNPQDSVVMDGVTAPTEQNDWITVGAGLESEVALQQGWCPLRVLPTDEVAMVRTVSGRRTTGDGVTAVTSYIDVQDFQTLYFFRKTIATRFAQPDFTRVKASQERAVNAKGEVIRLMQAFEDEEMFQAVSELAKLVVVERNASDRSRFDVYIPVNVVPGLHVIATRIDGTTLFDAFTV